jgi:hypothetical protein
VLIVPIMPNFLKHLLKALRSICGYSQNMKQR